ncbi:MAG: N-(5'-phosphoribosyl)anthranilate isomerase [Pirellulaceae bacterium]|nr:MAG: N-(5'-phosphoribosyl)anthranilate isomerase [Pirellulaceae bacterium]
MFRVKICGITNRTDLLRAVQLGADAVGVNFYQRSRRYVVPEEAAQWLPDAAECTRVGVFVNMEPERILQIAESVDLDMIQLHGDEPWEWIEKLRPWPVIRAIRCVSGRSLAAQLAQWAAAARPENLVAVLVDTAVPGQYGGTGQAGAWDSLGPWPDEWSDIPWILAGGLTPENVELAIRCASPFAVDVASGVESSPGRKDESKLKLFITRARQALGELAGGLQELE